MLYLAVFVALSGLAAADGSDDPAPGYGDGAGAVMICTGSYWQPPCNNYVALYTPYSHECWNRVSPSDNVTAIPNGSVQPKEYTLCRMYSDTGCTQEVGRTMWPGSSDTFQVVGVPVMGVACVAHYGGLEDPAWPIDVPQPYPTSVCTGPDDFSCYGPGVTGIPKGEADEPPVAQTTLKTYANTIVPTGVSSDTSLGTDSVPTSTPPYPLSNSTSLYGTAFSTGTSAPATLQTTASPTQSTSAEIEVTKEHGPSISWVSVSY